MKLLFCSVVDPDSVGFTFFVPLETDPQFFKVRIRIRRHQIRAQSPWFKLSFSKIIINLPKRPIYLTNSDEILGLTYIHGRSDPDPCFFNDADPQPAFREVQECSIYYVSPKIASEIVIAAGKEEGFSQKQTRLKILELYFS